VKNRLFLLTLIISLPLVVKAQTGTVAGMVNDATSGEALAGANVVVEGTNLGAAADAGGSYLIENVPAGTYTVTASVIGYQSSSRNVSTGEGTVVVNFSLSTAVLEMSELEVLASRADKNTPVAYTTVTKAEMEFRLGSQDIPMSLNTTPSVYATQQGGGAGDARINVRGFNQRNVAVMINGVPQNDMENGWVYWSNWDGVGDATSSIQMQRGLSAVNLATPSIGGTMNIITDPTAHKRGGKIKQELGAGNFLKTTINLNTGLINDKMAFSTTLVRKVGDGVVDATWTDAWAYYLGATYQMNDANRLELYAVGAPQRHGHNLYKQNIATYSQKLAGDTKGYDTEAYASGEKFQHEAGRKFNQNWAPVSSSYKGKQYWYMYGVGGFGGPGHQDRHDPNALNERENFFHKPLVNLNHFLTISETMRLSSVLYWSGGSGGGTGTYGSVSRSPAVEGNAWYASSPWTWDWDGEIAQNSANVDSAWSNTENRSTGILRNSINRQNTYGLISKLNLDMGNDLKLQFGVDWRTAGIEHAREVRDLLGGDYYVDFADDNAEDGKKVGLGDIIAYYNETTVDWLGWFAQASYSSGPINAYGMFGMSSIEYSYQDHFTVADEVIESEAISATQLKSGVKYNISDNMGIFGNFGIVEKPPIMDNVIYYDGTVSSNPENEKFQSVEAGMDFSSGGMSLTANYYMTDWIDRNLTKAVLTGQGSSGDTDVIFLTGVNQKHSGIEIEAGWQLMDMLKLDAIVSLGTWKFDGDASGNYQQAEFDTAGNMTGQTSTTYDYALDGLFVGDMPQTSYILGITLTPISGLKAQILYKTYDDHYSDWSPDDREYSGDDAESDRDQVWKAPGYSRMDVHVTYDLPSFGGLDLQAFAHIFNALDAEYIQDAVDHSNYNSFGDKTHMAHNAEVFLGTPMYFNAGLSVRF